MWWGLEIGALQWQGRQRGGEKALHASRANHIWGCRHPNNMLVKESSAEVVQIDFGICFDMVQIRRGRAGALMGY